MSLPPLREEPEDAEKLQRLVVQQRHEIDHLQLLIEKLKLQIIRLKRAQFGASSEQLHAPQLQLLLDNLQEIIGGNPIIPLAVELAPSIAAAETTPAPRRRALPPHLPREVIRYLPAGTAVGCTCAGCGGSLKHLGKDVSEQLEFVPSRFKVLRHVRPKFACARCATIHQGERANPAH